MKRLHKLNPYLFNGYLSLATTFIFILFTIFVLPNEAQKGEMLGFVSGPDTSFFYTADQLYMIADDYGAVGRAFYINQRFTFDIIWPLVYGSWLFITTGYLAKKNTFKKLKNLIYMPIIAVGFDFTENIATSVVMYRYPLKTIILDHVAGFATLFKWITLSVSILIVLSLLMLWLTSSYKKRKMHE